MSHSDENSPLLSSHRLGRLIQQDEEASSFVKSHVSVDEQALASSTVGERLAYNDYTTIDWLHDLVKDSYRLRHTQSNKTLRGKVFALWDSSSGWLAAALIGTLTACIAFAVDVAEATVSDWKFGYCARNPLLTRDACCQTSTTNLSESPDECRGFEEWSSGYSGRFGVYVGFALVFGVASSSLTMLTRSSLPTVADTAAAAAAAAATTDADDEHDKNSSSPASCTPKGKTMYMAAGSGIPEIKTILGGFVIPNFLSLRVLLVKALGAVFAVATGMCLGKEGPFVHISTCTGYLISSLFPKYRDNGRKMREMLSVACAAGLSVAFGAPIGGVLFSYEEISTHFPRKVLWRAFLCSAVAAMVLKALNPTGTGKLVLFETNYGTRYDGVHYLVFGGLGVAGGIFGGVFCRLNYLWGKWFRKHAIIKRNPVFEVFLIVAATALLQYPNPLIREPGDVMIKNLLIDCRNNGKEATNSWICRNEAQTEDSITNSNNWHYTAWLAHGTLAKLFLTIITFGIKVPSGVIIPSLDAGALFGRLIGQYIPSSSSSISPGIFAMVGAAAFLAGVSRMTISLCVIMFELTGELEYVIPHMLAILVAKWTADALSKEGVYDLAQSVLGHPFLDLDHSMGFVQQQDVCVEALIPPQHTMQQITLHVPSSNKVARNVLQEKLAQLQNRGLMDAGLVLVQHDHMLQGYIGQGELDFGLSQLGTLYPQDAATQVRLLGDAEEGDFDLSGFVDRTPLVLCAKAPMEYAVEMFAKLGLRHLMVTEEGSGRLVGVIIKKRLVAYLDELKHQE